MSYRINLTYSPEMQLAIATIATGGSSSMWSARLFREQQHDYGTGTAFPVSRGLAGRAGLPGDPGGHRDRPVQRRRTCHRTRPGGPAERQRDPGTGGAAAAG